MPNYIQWLRAHIGPAYIPLPYVTAIIYDTAGRVLLQHRADFGTAWWGLPGGLFELGEDPHTCLQREVFEETGLQIEPLRLVGVYSSPRYAITYPNGDQVQQITFTYQCRIVGGTLRVDGVETVAQAFFDLGALPPLPPWYSAMLVDAQTADRAPTFDPPAAAPVDSAFANPYPTLMTLRRVIGPAPVLWPGANALVLNAAGEVLLQQRGDFGVWGLPAGALDTGETLARTAQRETYEETGLLVEPRALLNIYGGHRVVYPNGDVLHPIGAVFHCEVVGGALRADGTESLAVRFFPPHALPATLSPLMRLRLEQALACLNAL